MLGRRLSAAVSLATLAGTIALAGSASAQLVPADPSNNSVLIDLGAIDGGAPAMRGNFGTAATVGSSGRLLMPPENPPSSRLLAPDGRPIMTAPALRAPAPEPRQASAPKLTPPAAAKAPSQQAKAAPKPQAPKAEAPSAPVALQAPTPPPDITPPPKPSAQASLPVAPQSAPKAAPQSAPKAAPKAGPTPPPAVAPAPPPDAPAVAKPGAAQQQASLPPQSAPAAKGAVPGDLAIVFPLGEASLSNEAKSQLDKLAETLKSDEKKRLQLLAYASEDQSSPSKARRLSLSRALAVRTHLIGKGIRGTRIDVRALGDQVPGGEPNRVDLQISDR